MKNVYFRASLVGFSMLVVSLLNLCLFENLASSKPTQMRESKRMKFKFEDYDVKSPEVFKAKMNALFPKGSSSVDFKKAMEESGAKCRVYDEMREEEGINMMGCEYSFGKDPFVKSKWIVAVKIGEDNQINDLQVTSGFVGV
jgi:hypothetical protein